MNEEKTTADGKQSGIRRRTLVAGTAWAVPAVTIAAAAPMASASVLCTGTFCVTGDFCKLPGDSADGCDGVACNKGYRAQATITASTVDRLLCYRVSAQDGITRPDVRICGGGATCTCTPTTPITCPTGYQSRCITASASSTQFTVDVCGFGNSQATTITIDYYIYRCDTGALIEHASTSGGAHPCK